MSCSHPRSGPLYLIALVVLCSGGIVDSGRASAQRLLGGEAPTPPVPSAISNPYRLVAGWPSLPPSIKWGGTIGILTDGHGGIWLQHRSEPPILHFDRSGALLAKFGEGTFVQAHGLCRDREGNFWAPDSGAYRETPGSAGRGFQIFKFSPEGKLLMTLGKAGVSRSGRDTFVGPSACIAAPNGDVIVADGHWPRLPAGQQDGDRLVRFTATGAFVREYGRFGAGPGEFVGPHGLAYDSQGRLFVADRSNNRIQIFDREMNFVDDWRHFGRPSGVVITKDDTLYVVDSESGRPIDGPAVSVEGGGTVLRNPGWKPGIRIGSARDGSLRYFIPNTRPEGLAVDESGDIFAGLTSYCDLDVGCIQKYAKK